MELLEALQGLFEPSRRVGLSELRDRLLELLDGRGNLLEAMPLQLPNPRAYRLRFESSRSVIVKRLEPAIAQRNELLANRWLPAVGLGHISPALLGVAADPKGRCVWHIYEDLGEGALDPQRAPWPRLKLAVEL